MRRGAPRLWRCDGAGHWAARAGHCSSVAQAVSEHSAMNAVDGRPRLWKKSFSGKMTSDARSETNPTSW
eukprot:4292279-Pyramimonas_sp.AAC.1